LAMGKQVDRGLKEKMRSLGAHRARRLFLCRLDRGKGEMSVCVCGYTICYQRVNGNRSHNRSYSFSLPVSLSHVITKA
jgi:hypothetical protein